MKSQLPVNVTTIISILVLILPTAISRAEMPEPLTDRAGNADKGRLVFLDSERGNCLLCHQLSTLDAPFQGNIGPVLDGVGERLSTASIRARIVDPTLLNANTAMPAYHRTNDLHHVATEYRGQPILNAQEVEDLVAFLDAQRISDQDKSP